MGSAPRPWCKEYINRTLILTFSTYICTVLFQSFYPAFQLSSHRFNTVQPVSTHFSPFHMTTVLLQSISNYFRPFQAVSDCFRLVHIISHNFTLFKHCFTLFHPVSPLFQPISTHFNLETVTWNTYTPSHTFFSSEPAPCTHPPGEYNPVPSSS